MMPPNRNFHCFIKGFDPLLTSDLSRNIQYVPLHGPWLVLACYIGNNIGGLVELIGSPWVKEAD